MRENFNKKVLSNGMTILFEKRDVPVVSVSFAIKSGSINEGLDEKGISHFIEHMVFKGTKNRSVKEIPEEIEKKGGEMNAFTSEELVGFYCKIPSKNLNSALEVLSDLVKNPLFDEKELEKERKVIFEEIKLYHDNPIKHVFNEIQRCLYGGSLSVDIIGTHETMNSIDREKLKGYFERDYFSENMVLTVVGDCEFDDLVNFCEKNFVKKEGSIPERDIELKNEVKVEKRKGIDQANLVFAYHVPLAGEKKSSVARVLNTLMADGMSSRLFSEVREKRNLAYAVKGGADINKRFAYNFVYVGTSPENVEEVKKIILEEFQKVSKELGDKELKQVKDQLIGQHQISMEDSSSQMMDLLASEIHTKAEDFYDFEKNISEVKLEDVKEMASNVKEGNYSFFALVPEE